MPTIGLIQGSGRIGGNGAGLAIWLQSLFDSHPSNATATYKILPIDYNAAPFPLGPIRNPTLPAATKNPADYPDADIRQWSEIVSGCDGFIVLTPQHNWGYPAELKLAFDHLYWEWRGKPFVLVTYGGHGGNHCAEQLKHSLPGGLKMKFIGPNVMVTLPGDYTGGSARVDPKVFGSEGEIPEWIGSQKEGVLKAFENLFEELKEKA